MRPRRRVPPPATTGPERRVTLDLEVEEGRAPHRRPSGAADVVPATDPGHGPRGAREAVTGFRRRVASIGLTADPLGGPAARGIA